MSGHLHGGGGQTYTVLGGGILGVRQMIKFLSDFVFDESGASAAEYALILAIVGVGIAGAAVYLRNTIVT